MNTQYWTKLTRNVFEKVNSIGPFSLKWDGLVEEERERWIQAVKSGIEEYERGLKFVDLGVSPVEEMI